MASQSNYGKGFETPTLIEVAYSNTDGSGPNLGLKPSTSDNYEIGAKAFVGDIARVNAAVFRTDTDSEIYGWYWYIFKYKITFVY